MVSKKEIRKRLRTLRDNIRTNTPRIEKKLSQSGTTPDPALVFSTAKYYKTLQRLAKE